MKRFPADCALPPEAQSPHSPTGSDPRAPASHPPPAHARVYQPQNNVAPRSLHIFRSAAAEVCRNPDGSVEAPVHSCFHHAKNAGLPRCHLQRGPVSPRTARGATQTNPAPLDWAQQCDIAGLWKNVAEGPAGLIQIEPPGVELSAVFPPWSHEVRSHCAAHQTCGVWFHLTAAYQPAPEAPQSRCCLRRSHQPTRSAT